LKTRFMLMLMFIATSAFAGADVFVTVSAPSTARPGEVIRWKATFENRGPDAARDVQAFALLATYEPCVNTTIATLAAGESRSFSCEVRLRVEPYLSIVGRGLYVYEAFARAAVPGIQDPTPLDNLAATYITLLTDPDLEIGGGYTRAATPGLPFPFHVYYSNVARTVATGVEITIQAPAAIAKAPSFCSISGNTATCRVADLGASDERGSWKTEAFDLELVAPDESEKAFEVLLDIKAKENDAYPPNNHARAEGMTYRTFYVTNANDAGSGSLRQAIEDANVSCVDTAVPCQVAFRIAEAKGPWQTIHLRSPLPFVTADNLSIDASTQARYFADTNPVGPEIEVDGSALTEGDGFRMESPCEMEVRGFAIDGFPRYGVYAFTRDKCQKYYTAQRFVRENYIGTDPTGMRALPNMRGVVIETNPLTGAQTISDNLISGNTRAGIFTFIGRDLAVYRNTIGLNRTHTAGLGNGASGVFFSARTINVDVVDNYIGFNAHAGVAFESPILYGSAGGNSYQANGGLAVDYGLDGVTERSPVPLPVITSARFENGQTIIEGTTDLSWAWIHVYANDAPDPSGYGEGQYTLGVVETHDNHFRFVHAGDLRGKWIAATATRVEYYGLAVQGATATTSSEFGRAVLCH
jgi:hypothetical protein